MTENFKEELLNFLDYLEDKSDPIYADEVSAAIKEFKKEHLI